MKKKYLVWLLLIFSISCQKQEIKGNNEMTSSVDTNEMKLEFQNISSLNRLNQIYLVRAKMN